MVIFNGQKYQYQNNWTYKTKYINIDSDLSYSEFLEKLINDEININEIALCDTFKAEYPSKLFISKKEYDYLKSISNKLYKNEFIYDMIKASNDKIVYSLIKRMDKFVDENPKYLGDCEYFSSSIVDYNNEEQIIEFFSDFKEFNNNANIKSNSYDSFLKFINTIDYEAFKEFMKIYNQELRYFSKTNMTKEFSEATEYFNDDFYDSDYVLSKDDLDVKASDKIMKTLTILDDDYFIKTYKANLEDSNHTLPYQNLLKLSLISMQQDISKTPEEFFSRDGKNVEKIRLWDDKQIVLAIEKQVSEKDFGLKKDRILKIMGDAYGLFEDFVDYKEQTGKSIEEIKQNCEALYDFRNEYAVFNLFESISCKDFDFFNILTSKEKEFINNVYMFKDYFKVKENYPKENFLITKTSMAFEHFINPYMEKSKVFEIYYNYPELRDAFKGNDYISSEKMNELYNQTVENNKATLLLKDFNTIFNYCKNKVEDKSEFENLFRKTLYNLDCLNNFLIRKVDLNLNDKNILFSFDDLKYKKHLLLNETTLDMLSNGNIDRDYFKEVVQNNFQKIIDNIDSSVFVSNKKQNIIEDKIFKSSFLEKTELQEMFEKNFRGKVPMIINQLQYISNNFSLDNEYIVKNFNANTFKKVAPFRNTELIYLAYHLDIGQIQDDKILVLAENVNENNINKFIEMKDVINDISNVLSKSDFNKFCNYLRVINIDNEGFLNLKHSFSELNMNEKIDLVKNTVGEFEENIRCELAEFVFKDLQKKYEGELTPHNLKDNSVQSGILTARILSKDNGLDSKDVVDLILSGEDTYCCFTRDGASEDALWESIANKNSSVWVIQDDEGKTLAQAWVWQDEKTDTLVFDNIEFKNNRGVKVFQEIICDYCENSPYKNIHMGTGYNKISLGDALEKNEQISFPFKTYTDYNGKAEVLKRNGQVLFTDEKTFKEIQAEDKENNLDKIDKQVVGISF